MSIAVSHGAGNDAGPADAEQIGNGGKKHKRRHTDSDGGKHGIAPRKAYKKSIRHVVQHQNDLTQHRRKSQLPDGLWNRGAFKQFLFAIIPDTSLLLDVLYDMLFSDKVKL